MTPDRREKTRLTLAKPPSQTVTMMGQVSSYRQRSQRHRDDPVMNYRPIRVGRVRRNAHRDLSQRSEWLRRVDSCAAGTQRGAP